MLGDPDLDLKLGSLIYILPLHLSTKFSPSQSVTMLLVSAVLEHPSLKLCKSCF